MKRLAALRTSWLMTIDVFVSERFLYIIIKNLTKLISTFESREINKPIKLIKFNLKNLKLK